jgi:hypothetical protein
MSKAQLYCELSQVSFALNKAVQRERKPKPQ